MTCRGDWLAQSGYLITLDYTNERMGQREGRHGSTGVTSSEEFLSIWEVRYRIQGREGQKVPQTWEACYLSHYPMDHRGQGDLPACCLGAGYRRQQQEKGLSKMR